MANILLNFVSLMGLHLWSIIYFMSLCWSMKNSLVKQNILWRCYFWNLNCSSIRILLVPKIIWNLGSLQASKPIFWVNSLRIKKIFWYSEASSIFENFEKKSSIIEELDWNWVSEAWVLTLKFPASSWMLLFDFCWTCLPSEWLIFLLALALEIKF